MPILYEAQEKWKRERGGEGEGDNRAITTLKKDLWYGDI